MVDFVAEYRPRKSRLHIERPSGFVAEERSSLRQRLKQEFAMKPHSPEIGPNYLASNGNDDFDHALNDVLLKKSVSKEKLTEVMKKSMITLVHTLLAGTHISGIHGSIKVSIGNSSEAISVNLGESYNSERDLGIGPDFAEIKEGIKLKNSITNQGMVLENEEMPCPESLCLLNQWTESYPSRDVPSLGSSPVEMLEDRGYLSPPSHFVIENNVNEVPFQRGRRESSVSEKSDSEEESGYSSNDRECLSDENGEEIVDVGSNGFSDAKEITSPEEDVDYSQLFNDPLVSVPISGDINREGDSTDNTIEKSVDAQPVCYKEQIDDKNELCCVMKTNDSTPLSSNDQNDQKKEATSDCDLEAPMDLSGDCNVKVIVQDNKEPDETKPVEINCKKCPVILFDIGAYQEHTLQFHQLHACTTCHKDFSSKNNLKRHVRIHTGSRPYKCNQCDMSFARRDDLKGHTLRHDYNKPFRCSLCRKGYTDRACVKNHMLKEHCSRLMQICPECGESFDRDEVFLEHKKSHPSLQQFACDTCLFIGTNHLMALKHKLLHTFKLFSCKPCNAYFADPFGYTKHVRKHKKTPEFSCYVCCFCDISLPTYEQYVRHEYSHAQGKLHECNVCKKQFKNKATMQEHTFAHCDSALSNETVTVDKVEINSTETEMDCLEENSVNSQDCKTSHKHSTTLNSANDENDKNNDLQDSFQGQLLDLSLKSTVSDNSCPKELPGVDTAKPASVPDISSPRTTSLSNLCVPRNGCAAIETRVLAQEKSAHDCSLVESQTSSSDENFRIVWQSPTLLEKTPTEERENTLRKFEKIQGQFLSFQTQKMLRERCNQVTPAVSSDRHQKDKKDIRYHPFSKIFVSKFMAARGSNLLKEIGNAQNHSVLSENESIASSVATFSQAFFKSRSKDISTSPDAFQNYSFKGEEPGSIEPVSENMVIGLSGKPCPARSRVEEPIVNNTAHSSPVLKTEKIDDDSIPTSTSDLLDNPHQPMTPSSPISGGVRECEICNTIFESFYHLESHSVVQHKRYLCEFCGKGFTARPNRDRHVRYHTGERPYKCDLCPLAFTRGDDLKNHRTSRHRTEIINCNKCSASFTWQKDLERHKRHSKCVA